MARNKNKPREDGRIKVSIYLGVVDGKRKYKYVYGTTQAEADRKAREVRKRLLTGERIEAGDQPFSMWAERYLAKKELDVATTYYIGLKGRCDYWCRTFGSTPVSKILTSDIQCSIDALAKCNPLTGKPTAKKTLTDYKNAALAIFDLAMRDRAITYNPAQYVDIPRSAPRTDRFALTAAERDRIMEMPHRAQAAAVIMMLAGLRRGELLALTVGDVDFDAAAIHVDKSIVYGDDNNTPILKRGGKTDSAVRTVPMPQQLVTFLRPLLCGRSPLEIIVAGRDGKHMTKSAWKRMWESYITDLNATYGQPVGNARSKYDPQGIAMAIRPFTAHTLRHTYATILHAAGVDVLTAQKLLGHADVKTTLSVYTHLEEGMVSRDVRKLDDFLAAQA